MQVQEVGGVGLVFQAETGTVEGCVDHHVLELVAGAQSKGQAKRLIVNQRLLAGIQTGIDVIEEEGADLVLTVSEAVLAVAVEQALLLFLLHGAQVEIALHVEQLAGGQHLVGFIELVAGHRDGDVVRIGHLVEVGVNCKAVGQRLLTVVGDLVVQAQAGGGQRVGQLQRAGEGIGGKILLIGRNRRHAGAPCAVRSHAVVVGEGFVNHHAVQIARFAVLHHIALMTVVGVVAILGAVGEGEENRHAVVRGALKRLVGGHEHLTVLIDRGVELKAAGGRDLQLYAIALEHDLRRAAVQFLFICLEVLHRFSTLLFR